MKNLCCPRKYKMSNEMEFNIIEEKQMITFYEIWLSKKRTDNPYRIDFDDDAGTLLYDFVFRETLITSEDFSHLFNLIYRFNPSRTIPDELPDNELGERIKNDFKKRGLLIEEEEKKISPQKRTKLSKKNKLRKRFHLKHIGMKLKKKEKEKLRLKIEEEKKQKQRNEN